MKKGFTLVELLAVIVILGVVATITVPIISTSISESKNKAYDRQVDLIIEAARSYMSKNPAKLGDSVTVSTLKNEGFLGNKIIKNPLYVEGSSNEKTKSQNFSGIVCVKYSSGKYNYVYKESNAC